MSRTHQFHGVQFFPASDSNMKPWIAQLPAGDPDHRPDRAEPFPRFRTLRQARNWANDRAQRLAKAYAVELGKRERATIRTALEILLVQAEPHASTDNVGAPAMFHACNMAREALGLAPLKWSRV